MRITHQDLRQIIKEEYAAAKLPKKRIMNESVIRYKLYEAAIETGLTSDQYHRLMSEGILDWVKDALNSITAGKEMAGDIKRMFADKKNQVIYQKATQDIQKSVEELFKAGAAAGVDKTALKDWLVAGINKVTEEAAASAPETDKAAAEAAAGTPVGKPVDPAAEQSVPTLAAAAAQAAGQDPEKAKEQAVEQGIDAPKATKILANAIAKGAGVDAGLAEKVIDWLLKNKHLKAENKSRLTANDVLKAAKSALASASSASNGIMLERWTKLAGLIKEAGIDKKTSEADEKKFEKLFDEIEAELKIDDPKQFEDLKKIVVALDSLENLEVS